MCGQAYPRYQDYNTVWNLTEWMEVLEQAATYFKDTVGKDLPDEEVQMLFKQMGICYESSHFCCFRLKSLNCLQSTWSK